MSPSLQSGIRISGRDQRGFRAPMLFFRHHRTGLSYPYKMHNTPAPLRELLAATQEMDRWFLDCVDGWQRTALVGHWVKCHLACSVLQ